ncbi:MAG: hypothetical protein LBV45_10035 [Xanthomonadaceae bacterium]|jgi:hypothetical protein|nr:hypothetical protein [Xanthomonadaceae bacterium]
MSPHIQRAFVLSALVLLLTGTRLHHFAAIPDASWAVFFLGGFYLRDWARWAFPTLMTLAVAIDWLVITGQGIPFWSHYCVSPAYWCLVPAYLALWAGGVWLHRGYRPGHWRELGRLAGALLVSVAVCHLVSQGSYYWTSSMVATPDLAGWAKNYFDWLLPFLRVAAMYVAMAAAIQIVMEQFIKSHPRRQDGVAHWMRSRM